MKVSGKLSFYLLFVLHCFETTCKEEDSVCTPTRCKNGSCQLLGNYPQCICDDGFVGTYCESDINDCLNVNCHSGTCIDGINGYKCKCKTGFTGKHCEVNINECTGKPCMNEGICTDNVGNFTCLCQEGYSGRLCERKDCSSNFCLNGGSCHEVNGLRRCSCTIGYEGVNCETYTSCPVQGCHRTFNDGQCIRECNIPDCKFDQGHCAFGIENPWSNCKKKNCWALFENGVCNLECNNKDCLYDGNDCRTPKNCSLGALCKSLFNNNKCDASCNTVECGYDDCNENTVLVPGKLQITLLSSKAHFETKRVDFVRQMNTILDTHLSIEGMDEEHYGNQVRKRREASVPRLKMTTSLRNEKGCTYCFETATGAANFLAAKSSKKLLDLPVDIFSVSAVKDDDAKPKDSLNTLWIGIICSAAIVLVMVSVVAGKKVKATLWLPSGHSQAKLRKTMVREPGVGQEKDEISLKNKSDDEDDEDKPFCRSSSTSSNGSTLHSKEDSSQFEKDSLILSEEETDTPFKREIDTKQLPIPDTPGSGTQCSSMAVNHRSRSHTCGESNLHLAARLGKTELANQLISIGVDLNERDCTGRTPLQASVNAGATDVFRVLVRNKKCKVDNQANDGTTALMDACRSASHYMVNELMTAGAKVNLSDNQGNTSLHHAACANNNKSSRTLLKNAGKVDLRNKKGETPMLIAAREGSYATVCILLEHSANRDARDKSNNTPLTVARSKGHNDVYDLLKIYGSTPSAATLRSKGARFKPKHPFDYFGSIIPYEPEDFEAVSVSPNKRKRKANEHFVPRNDSLYPYSFAMSIPARPTVDSLQRYHFTNVTPPGGVLDHHQLLHEENSSQQELPLNTNWLNTPCMDTHLTQIHVIPKPLDFINGNASFTNVASQFATGSTMFFDQQKEGYGQSLNMDNPYPTPPSTDEQSPPTDHEMHQSPNFPTPSPESYMTTSPDSYVVQC